MMKRTVELISFDDRQVTVFRKQQVAVVILQDASQESVAVDMRLLQQMRRHRRYGCLSMCSGNANSARRAGNQPE